MELLNQGKMERHCVTLRQNAQYKYQILLLLLLLLFDGSNISNRAEAFHLRFDREFLKMERQVSVGPDRTRQRGPSGSKRSIYVSTEISGNFGNNGKHPNSPSLTYFVSSTNSRFFQIVQFVS